MSRTLLLATAGSLMAIGIHMIAADAPSYIHAGGWQAFLCASASAAVLLWWKR